MTKTWGQDSLITGRLACLDADAGFHFSSQLWLLARTSPCSFSMWSWIFFKINSGQVPRPGMKLHHLQLSGSREVSSATFCLVWEREHWPATPTKQHSAGEARRTRNIAVTIFGKYNLPHSSKLPRNFSCKEHIPSWFSWGCIIKKMPQFFSYTFNVLII